MPEIDTVLERFEADASQAVSEVNRYAQSYDALTAAMQRASTVPAGGDAGASFAGARDVVAALREQLAALAPELQRLIGGEAAAGDSTAKLGAGVLDLEAFMEGLSDGLRQGAGELEKWQKAQADAAAEAQAIEDRYTAIAATNGDRALAERLVRLNAAYARELAVVDHAGQSRVQITEQYNREVAAIEDAVAMKRAGLSKGMHGLTLEGSAEAAAARRKAEQEIAEARRAAESVQEIEDRYAALRITNGDRSLAQRYLSLNRAYARELALVSHSSQTRLEITAQYEREMAALQEQVAARSVQATERSSQAIAGPGTQGLLQWKREAGRTREAAQMLVGSLGTIAPTSAAVGAGLRFAAAAALGAGGIILALEAIHAASAIASSALDYYRQKQEAAAKAAKDHSLALRELTLWGQNFTFSFEKAPRALAELRSKMQELDREAAPLQYDLAKLAKEVLGLEVSAESLDISGIAALREEMTKLEIAAAEAGNVLPIAKIQELLTALDRLEQRRQAVGKLSGGLVDKDVVAERETALTSLAQKGEQERQRAVQAALDRGLTARRQAIVEFDRTESDLATAQRAEVEREAVKRGASLQVIARSSGDELRAIAEGLGIDVVAIDQKYGEARGAAAKVRNAKLRDEERAAALDLAQARTAVASLGANDADKARADGKLKVLVLQNDLARAEESGDAEAVKRVKEKIGLQRQANAITLALIEAEFQARRAVATYEREQDREREAEAQALARADRFDVAKNLGAAGGDLGKSRRLVALQQELDQERILLEEAAQEHPELESEIELAKTELVRRGARERRRILQDELKTLAESLVDAGGDFGKAKQLAAVKTETDAEVQQLMELQARYPETWQQTMDAVDRIYAEAAAKRGDILHGELAQLKDFAQSALQDLAGRLGSAFGDAVSGSAALDGARRRQAQAEVDRARAELQASQRAVQAAKSEKEKQKALEETRKKQEALTEAERQAGLVAGLSGAERGAAIAAFTQEFLANLAKQAAANAIYETGMALATQGLTWGVPNGASVNHWAAAAVFGGMALVAGAGAYALGQTRGMTRDEKGSLASSSSSSGASADGTSSSGGGSSSGDQVQRETVYVVYVADPVETPAEAAQRLARRFKLVKDLDMQRREN